MTAASASFSSRLQGPLQTEPSILLGTQRLPVTIVEAIRHDVRLTVNRPIRPGQALRLVFPGTTKSGDYACPGCVHWMNSGRSSTEIGIALSQRLPAEFERRDPGCLRDNIRFPCRVSGKVSWAVAGIPSSTTAVVLDYSREGISFQGPQAPPKDMLVDLEWQNQEKSGRVSGTARWVVGKPGGFLVGCQVQEQTGYQVSGVTLRF